MLRGFTSPREYAQFLERDRDEAEALYRDVLINVTSFFRDPEMFEDLKREVFPAIVNGKPEGPPDPRVGAWLLDWPGGLFDCDGPAGVSGYREDAAVDPGLRHRSRRSSLPRQGACGRLSGEHRGGSQPRAPRTVLRQRGASTIGFRRACGTSASSPGRTSRWIRRSRVWIW